MTHQVQVVLITGLRASYVLVHTIQYQVRAWAYHMYVGSAPTFFQLRHLTLKYHVLVCTFLLTLFTYHTYSYRCLSQRFNIIQSWKEL